jgi:AcrR family transcriptional regulator
MKPKASAQAANLSHAHDRSLAKRAKRGGTRGRPRSFDPEEVLDAMLRLFATHGFEGVTLPMMEEATGLTRPSLYRFFGDKEEVFLKAIDLHASRSAMMSPDIVGRAESLAQGIHDILVVTARGMTDPDRSPGCMILAGSLAGRPEHGPLIDEVAARRERYLEDLTRHLGRWLPLGPAVLVARSILAVMQGIAIQAQDGGTRKELEEVARFTAQGLAAGLTALLVD